MSNYKEVMFSNSWWKGQRQPSSITIITSYRYQQALWESAVCAMQSLVDMPGLFDRLQFFNLFLVRKKNRSDLVLTNRDTFSKAWTNPQVPQNTNAEWLEKRNKGGIAWRSSRIKWTMSEQCLSLSNLKRHRCRSRNPVSFLANHKHHERAWLWK